MKIKRKELMDKIVLVRPGLTKKEIMEQSNYFVFTGQEIATHNGYVSVRCPYRTDFKCSIPFDKFYGLLSNIEDETIDISVKGKEILVESSRVRSGMVVRVDNVIESRLQTIPQPKKWIVLPEDFIEGVFLCMFSVSKDMYCDALNCVSIEGNNIYSSDDLRISHYTMTKKVPDKFLLPLAVVVELVKYKMDRYSIDEKSGWICFTNKEGIVFSAGCLLDKFPDASQFFNVKGTKIILPKKLQMMIDTITPIIDDLKDIEKIITVTIDSGKVVCKAEQERGWIEEEMEIKYTGKKVELCINPVFLHEVLDRSSEMIIDDKRALFVSKSFQHVMALPTVRGK